MHESKCFRKRVRENESNPHFVLYVPKLIYEILTVMMVAGNGK